jgi:Zn finger protein HypA/HybF involved in hydrogenase expression
MWTRPFIARLQHSPEDVRCECKTCGAHTYSPPNSIHIHRCGNCQSLSLAPVDVGPGRFGGAAAA